MLKPVINGHDVLPPSLLDLLDFNDPDPFIDACKDSWNLFLKQNTALTALVVFGISVAILLPISGIITCVIYCCCGCNSYARERGKKIKFHFFLSFHESSFFFNSTD